MTVRLMLAVVGFVMVLTAIAFEGAVGVALAAIGGLLALSVATAEVLKVVWAGMVLTRLRTPPSFREKLRERIPEDARADFDSLCEWEDGILDFLTDVTTEGDRYREALEELYALHRGHPGGPCPACRKAEEALGPSDDEVLASMIDPRDVPDETGVAPSIRDGETSTLDEVLNRRAEEDA